MIDSCCAVVPHYEHTATVGRVVDALRDTGLAVVVVDDGSAPPARRRLRELLEGRSHVHLVWRTDNGGKGAAVKDGLRAAWLLGHSHALQVDADGQHRVEDARRLLEVAAGDPAAIVCARPVFDESVPPARLYGRKLTNFWIAVETWSRDIEEAMCGFRVYPLAPVVALLGTQRLGDRMDFDIEVLVRAWWSGLRVRYVSTPVNYPANGVSHFRLVRDNVGISLCHARLVCGMLRRSPRLAARACKAAFAG